MLSINVGAPTRTAVDTSAPRVASTSAPSAISTSVSGSATEKYAGWASGSAPMMAAPMPRSRAGSRSPAAQASSTAVSYTHLDVYKRQEYCTSGADSLRAGAARW